MTLKFYSDWRATGRLLRAGNSFPFETSNVVVFFCAQWCGVCRSLLASLDAAFAQPAMAALSVSDWLWVDVEDAADDLPMLDIETFPTVGVITGGKLRMLGPVLPEQAVWVRVVQSALQSDESLTTPEAKEVLALIMKWLGNK